MCFLHLQPIELIWTGQIRWAVHHRLDMHWKLLAKLIGMVEPLPNRVVRFISLLTFSVKVMWVHRRRNQFWGGNARVKKLQGVRDGVGFEGCTTKEDMQNCTSESQIFYENNALECTSLIFQKSASECKTFLTFKVRYANSPGTKQRLQSIRHLPPATAVKSWSGNRAQFDKSIKFWSVHNSRLLTGSWDKNKPNHCHFARSFFKM